MNHIGDRAIIANQRLILLNETQILESQKPNWDLNAKKKQFRILMKHLGLIILCDWIAVYNAVALQLAKPLNLADLISFVQ